MQRDIQSYFKKLPSKNNKSIEPDKATASSPVKLKTKKRKAIIYSSDEDEEKIPASPQVSNDKANKRLKTHEDKRNSADSREYEKNKKPNLSKLKKVDPTALFGGEMTRIEAKKPPKPKDAAVIELEDDNIDESLMEVNVDESALNSSKRVHKTTPKKDEKTTPNKKTPSKSKIHGASAEKQKSGKKREKSVEKESPNAKKPKKSDDVKTPQSIKKAQTIDTEKALEKPKTPSNQKKSKAQQHTPCATNEEHSDLESSVLSDEERHERKRMAAILYQKYKNRSSCLNPGSKEVPKGSPNCLSGLSFLVTGILESLERDEANSIIKEYGGKVMSTVGKRLNYLIVGEEAGPKKLAQAEENGITVLSEDGLFDLIRERSNGGSDTKKNAQESVAAPKAINKEKKSEKIEEKPLKPIKKGKAEEDVKKIKVEKSPAKHSVELNNNQMKVKEELKQSVDVKHAIKQEVSEDMLAWVDKYKPESVKDIIGQQGAASNVVKLTNWLSKWYVNHDGKKKLQRPNPWAKNDDGSYYKAALLSGPPGIGKTTTATLVCKELGFDVVEFNASDTRSKRLLKEEVSELLSNKSLYGYCHGKAQAITKKHALIMDEVDGMAGNEDRGGIQELIGLIKDSSVPIICMCNDRNHQKMRSLVNYCYDLRFNRPRLEQIKGRLMSICFKEKIKIEPSKMEEIIAATNNDIRQSINHIALLSGGKELNLAVKKEDKTAQKDMKMGPWEVVRRVLSAEEHKNMNIYEKCDLFFNDYSLAPLFVQQNYLIVSPSGPKSEELKKVALTADALSLGDLCDKRIRSSNAWSLLPAQAVFSSLLPGEYMSGTFRGQINFPGWLGKNSRANKRSRLAQEIHDHTRVCTSGSRLSVRLDYAPFLVDAIVRPLREKGTEGVEESLRVIKEYQLLREDIDSLIELTSWPGIKNPMDAVDGRVKAALTRAYNKEVMPYSYSAMAGVKKKRAEANDETVTLDTGGEEGDDGDIAAADSADEKEDDSLENDGLIKAKKKTAASSAPAKGKGGASTSKKAAGGGSKSRAKK